MLRSSSNSNQHAKLQLQVAGHKTISSSSNIHLPLLIVAALFVIEDPLVHLFLTPQLLRHKPNADTPFPR